MYHTGVWVLILASSTAIWAPITALFLTSAMSVSSQIVSGPCSSLWQKNLLVLTYWLSSCLLWLSRQFVLAEMESHLYHGCPLTWRKMSINRAPDTLWQIDFYIEYLASFMASSMAADILLPSAACSSGMGTANTMPFCSCNSWFASVASVRRIFLDYTEYQSDIRTNHFSSRYSV